MTKAQAMSIVKNINLTTAEWTALEWYLKNKGEGK